ncbi:MAG TPA: alpha/beta hydrolase-fold protein [Gammaproteobacteria bacterium]|jgi:phospholipase/carboxylesterase|nr:alpha/beta hydrolase-fold protein [Gammaproteobacteria bacterium]
MNEPLLKSVEINPAGAATAAIIWLHGLGADGHDFEPLIPQLGVVDELGVRVILPHAPHMPVTINNGMVMPAWYDIRGNDFRQAQDEQGIRTSASRLEALIARETARGIVPGRIILAGFSQGGAIALYTGLRHAGRLGGILALSTYLPMAERLAGEAAPANRDVPVMMAHGTADPVVPLHLAEQARALLEAHGNPVEWHSYPMQHSVSPQEIADIRQWLLTILRA